MPRELRFSIYGKQVAVVGGEGAWSAYLLGAEGKRRAAEFAVPGFLSDDELCQLLADLFHEHATPINSAYRIK
ncbi:MAG: hypothetical protein M3O26_12015 [Pseudomonadota bacterium]|nr:hypothetical protein [Pseudomonadota bacterium]